MKVVLDTNVFISGLMLPSSTPGQIVAAVAANVPRDANDNMVLATLLAGKAEFLITGDEDLLVLATDYPIVTPADFVRRIN